MSQGNMTVRIDDVEEPEGLDPENDTEVDPNDEGADAEKKPEIFTYNEESSNLVDEFEGHPEGVQALKDIANQVYDDFTADYDASEEYRKRFASTLKLFMGDLPAKEYPFENCANPHLPIVLMVISRVGFRAVDELFSDWDQIYKVLPVGPAGDDMADVLTIHGNWQIRNTIPDFKRQMHRGVLAFFLGGDVTCHSFYDESLRQNRHEILTPDEFVTPFAQTTAMPDYSDLPHYTKIMYRYRHDLQRMKDKWSHIDEVIDHEAPAWSDDPESILERATSETIGVDMDGASTSPYKLLWYEGWLELPNQDRDRFCQVILDYRTKTVMKLSIHEMPDWQDLQRFRQQQSELDAFRRAQEMHMQQTQDLQAAQTMVGSALGDQTGIGAMGPLQASMVQNHLEASQGPEAQPPPPAPPTWMNDPNDPEEQPQDPQMNPIRLFAHAVCIEPLIGNLGVGFGNIEADLNRAANTALSQFTDSATFANLKFFLVPDNVDMPKDAHVEPGAFIKIPGLTAEEMAGIREISMSEPSRALFEVAEKMVEIGEGAMQAPEVLSGEPGKSGETYRGLSARIEQASKQLSVPTRKFGDFLQQILVNNGRLNFFNLRDGEIEAVIAQQIMIPSDKQGPMMEIAKRGKDLYGENYQVEIRADMRFTSQAQRIQEADQVVGLAAPGGPLQGNIPLLQYALAKSFEARNRRDLVPYLGPQMPPPATPLGLPPPPPPGALPENGQEPPAGGKPVGAAKPGPQAPNPPPPQPAQPGAPGIS